MARKQKAMLAYQLAACGRYSNAQLLDLLPWFACIPVILQDLTCLQRPLQAAS